MKIGETNNVQKLYVTPDICGEMILGEDCLCQHKAQIKFNPAVLIVNGEQTPLGRAPDKPVSVVIDTDIKLPTRTAVSGSGRLVTKGKLGKGIFQITPVEKYSPEEEEKVALCEIVVDALFRVSIMFSNLANKTMKIMKGEEV